jgi:hypothetical protein
MKLICKKKFDKTCGVVGSHIHCIIHDEKQCTEFSYGRNPCDCVELTDEQAILMQEHLNKLFDEKEARYDASARKRGWRLNKNAISDYDGKIIQMYEPYCEKCNVFYMQDYKGTGYTGDSTFRGPEWSCHSCGRKYHGLRYERTLIWYDAIKDFPMNIIRKIWVMLDKYAI